MSAPERYEECKKKKHCQSPTFLECCSIAHCIKCPGRDDCGCVDCPKVLEIRDWIDCL